METVETLNKRLQDYYGVDSDTGRPIFRIVWANDQLEMRLTKYLDSGIELINPVVREVKKYSYLKDMYVLERLVVVPVENEKEIPVSKLSYEPIWAYRSHLDNEPLPPKWEPTKLIIDVLLAAQGKKSLRKYVEDEKNTTIEGREQRINELQRDLFGNETDTGDALAYKEGVTVPSNYERTEK